MEIKRSSWLYKLVIKEQWYEDRYTDVCTFTRALLSALATIVLMTLFVLLGAGVLLYITGDFLAWIAFMLYNWQWAAPSEAAVIVSLILIVGSFAGVALLISKGSKAVVNNVQPLKEMYGSITNRFCSKVVIKD